MEDMGITNQKLEKIQFSPILVWEFVLRTKSAITFLFVDIGR
jgi:hypothetical protein